MYSYRGYTLTLLSFGILAAIALGLLAWSQYLFATGRKLKA